MEGAICYGVEDWAGFLWFDDFASQEDAQEHCDFINNGDSMPGTCKPFKVTQINATGQP